MALTNNAFVVYVTGSRKENAVTSSTESSASASASEELPSSVANSRLSALSDDEISKMCDGSPVLSNILECQLEEGTPSSEWSERFQRDSQRPSPATSVKNVEPVHIPKSTVHVITGGLQAATPEELLKVKILPFLTNTPSLCFAEINLYTRFGTSAKVLLRLLDSQDFLTKPAFWLSEKRLSPFPNKCRYCSFELYLKEDDQSKDGYSWICSNSNCSYVQPYKRPGFFASCVCSLKTLLALTFHWSFQSNLSEIQKDCKLNNAVMLQMWLELRNVCDEALKRTTVRIRTYTGEIAVFKYGQCLIVAMMDRNTRFTTLKAVSFAKYWHRSRLIPLVVSLVASPAVIISDCWLLQGLKAHDNEFHFVDPLITDPTDAGWHNLNVKNYVKKHLFNILSRFSPETMKVEVLQSFLTELQWRERFGHYPEQAFWNILYNIAGQDCGKPSRYSSTEEAAILRIITEDSSPDACKVCQLPELDEDALEDENISSEMESEQQRLDIVFDDEDEEEIVLPDQTDLILPDTVQEIVLSDTVEEVVSQDDMPEIIVPDKNQGEKQDVSLNKVALGSLPSKVQVLSENMQFSPSQGSQNSVSRIMSEAVLPDKEMESSLRWGNEKPVYDNSCNKKSRMPKEVETKVALSDDVRERKAIADGIIKPVSVCLVKNAVKKEVFSLKEIEEDLSVRPVQNRTPVDNVEVKKAEAKIVNIVQSPTQKSLINEIDMSGVQVKEEIDSDTNRKTSVKMKLAELIKTRMDDSEKNNVPAKEVEQEKESSLQQLLEDTSDKGSSLPLSGTLANLTKTPLPIPVKVCSYVVSSMSSSPINCNGDANPSASNSSPKPTPDVSASVIYIPEGYSTLTIGNLLSIRTWPTFLLLRNTECEYPVTSETVVESLKNRLEEQKFFGSPVHWLISRGLILDHIPCYVCGFRKNLLLVEDTRHTEEKLSWICINKTCKNRRPFNRPKFFTSFGFSMKDILHLIYHWAVQSDMSVVAKDVHLNEYKIRYVYWAIQKLCSKNILVTAPKLGNNGHIVEVVIMQIGQYCIIGALDRYTMLTRLKAIPAPIVYKTGMIESILSEWLEPWTCVVTNYDNFGIKKERLVHALADEKSEMNITAISTYVIKLVNVLFGKYSTIGVKLEIIQGFLDEIQWRERHGVVPDAAFWSLLTQISEEDKIEVEKTRHFTNKPPIFSIDEALWKTRWVSTIHIDSSVLSGSRLVPVSIPYNTKDDHASQNQVLPVASENVSMQDGTSLKYTILKDLKNASLPQDNKETPPPQDSKLSQDNLVQNYDSDTNEASMSSEGKQTPMPKVMGETLCVEEVSVDSIGSASALPTTEEAVDSSSESDVEELANLQLLEPEKSSEQEEVKSASVTPPQSGAPLVEESVVDSDEEECVLLAELSKEYPAKEQQLEEERAESMWDNRTLTHLTPTTRVLRPVLHDIMSFLKKNRKKRSAATSPNSLYVSLDEYYFARMKPKDVPPPPPLPDRRTYVYNCSLCKRFFYSNVAVIVHTMDHAKEHQMGNSLGCALCFLDFPSESALQYHVREVHVISSPFSCLICCQVFPSPTQLSKHMKLYHVASEMPYACPACRFRSSLREDITEHFNSAHMHEPHLVCPYCLKMCSPRAKNDQVLFTQTYCQHLIKHHVNPNKLRCPSCCLSFLSVSDMNAHLYKDHISYAGKEAVFPFKPRTNPVIVTIPEPPARKQTCFQRPIPLKPLLPRPPVKETVEDTTRTPTYTTRSATKRPSLVLEDESSLTSLLLPQEAPSAPKLMKLVPDNVTETTELPVLQDDPIISVPANTPIISVRANTPIISVRANSPIISVRANSPMISGRANTPIISVRANSPIISVRANSPMISGRANSPIISVRANSPIISVRENSPIISVRENSPIISVRANSPIISVRANTPEEKVSPIARAKQTVTENDDVTVCAAPDSELGKSARSQAECAIESTEQSESCSAFVQNIDSVKQENQTESENVFVRFSLDDTSRCIECGSHIDKVHFLDLLICHCKYSTHCVRAFINHMAHVHSTVANEMAEQKLQLRQASLQNSSCTCGFTSKETCQLASHLKQCHGVIILPQSELVVPGDESIEPVKKSGSCCPEVVDLNPSLESTPTNALVPASSHPSAISASSIAPYYGNLDPMETIPPSTPPPGFTTSEWISIPEYGGNRSGSYVVLGSDGSCLPLSHCGHIAINEVLPSPQASFYHDYTTLAMRGPPPPYSIGAAEAISFEFMGNPNTPRPGYRSILLPVPQSGVTSGRMSSNRTTGAMEAPPNALPSAGCCPDTNFGAQKVPHGAVVPYDARNAAVRGGPVSYGVEFDSRNIPTLHIADDTNLRNAEDFYRILNTIKEEKID